MLPDDGEHRLRRVYRHRLPADGIHELGDLTHHRDREHRVHPLPPGRRVRRQRTSEWVFSGQPTGGVYHVVLRIDIQSLISPHTAE
ncbi:hypothetical protein IFM12275_32620 [Nocardia sputorum]|uniref:Uncharacterized protein n=1 Tax=Nocardia sputorum TaxID=2984338 RepID=A0ABN6UDK0_9NOCA|nr:hypothetical protein IFM12275_32620 [Nocardia sputorum]BDU03393.1 hypothetical protein IFM12276_64210 [Nocardia sputorum]